MHQDEGILVGLDASLFTESSSVGHLTGDVVLPFLPTVGSKMALFSDLIDGPASVLESLVVEHVLPPQGGVDKPLVMLSDVVVKTKCEAFEVAQYLERRLGLYADIHDEDDLLQYRALKS